MPRSLAIMEFVSLLISHREPKWGLSGDIRIPLNDEQQEMNEYALSDFVL